MAFFKEFKEFATRGNVVDLAVAVIIGAAFSKIVSSFVDDLVTPLILTPALKAAKVDKIADLSWNGIMYGNFLAAVLNFIVIAFVLFLMIKGINSLKKKEEPKPEAPAGPSQEELLTQIRDLLKNK
ncbi:large conductance mechanosensitive channel protein MscL [Ornithobacterium rhinotracheale]|uniref:Large-conductance mechanosensitive channel n=1 Tax=Ornithobacterium rhinotracheale (strain ATCC 51463 / DSM 15997 / CCUG 23171 / CIP 104009 / LMG 9086) TaxID=867902 RepID=I4A1N7_ORNRL|nr:large conductance mechanosensitive channel protein MscL [Ornithobacterium rhinotracheale]AFL97871.1 large conductance mechanosensitive channel protein [Ornithobacterium rhinotracheale DSM 15997]AIP99691.1 large-conductance mechanosensitive channel [Ornithobacterium rhinotracheale ORT-UMN 88]KGB65924.1 large-conductance mechanosensitive channel [Ornithobacterium rhinotracheale H06-030791]MBN3661549.1 large conductance mechanosensitive channel protein MscL [Ornithobacterium rhinotracheale]MCK